MRNPIWQAAVKSSAGGGGGDPVLEAMDSLYTLGRAGEYFYTDPLTSFEESTPITGISASSVCGLTEGQRTIDPSLSFDLDQPTAGLKAITAVLASSKLALNFPGSGDILNKTTGPNILGPGAYSYGFGVFFRSATKNCGLVQLLRSGGQTQIFSKAGNLLDVSSGQLVSSPLATNTYHTVIVIGDGVNSELYVDGLLDDTGNITAGANWTQYQLGGIGNPTFNCADWDAHAHFIIEGDIAALGELTVVNNFLARGL